MFKRSSPKDFPRQDLEKLKFDNKLLEYELLKIRNLHPELFDNCSDVPDILFAVAAVHSRKKIITTPFIEIQTFVKILLLVWLSGISGGIAIFLLTIDDFWIRLVALPAIGVMLVFLLAAFASYVGETVSSRKTGSPLIEKFDVTTPTH